MIEYSTVGPKVLGSEGLGVLVIHPNAHLVGTDKAKWYHPRLER